VLAKKKKRKTKEQKIMILLLSLLASVAAQTYHSEVLDMMGKYTLHWGITNTTLELKAVVNATGWVAFGLSPNGGMKGSDIVMGWINADGSKSFSDRHAPENDVPSSTRFNRTLCSSSPNPMAALRCAFPAAWLFATTRTRCCSAPLA
jgi:hypothetical protein